MYFLLSKSKKASKEILSTGETEHFIAIHKRDNILDVGKTLC